MESFFDFIFGNLFFVIIIIAAIFNFFNKSKQEEAQERSKEQAGPERESTRRPTLRERMEEALLDLEDEWKSTQETEPVEDKQATKMPSVEEQRQAQYERLRNQYQTATVDEDDYAAETRTMKTKEQEKELEKIKTTAHRKMTKKTLVDGVIMAEILGPPRALKPYESVIQERRR